MIGNEVKISRIALGCLFAGVASAAQAQGIACEVASIEGTNAEIWRAGGAIPATVAMPVDAGDQVRTRADSRVTLSCTGDMRITVGPDTTLDLGRMGGGDVGWAVFLLDGIAGFLRPLFGTDRFEVRTPSAVASVRSTEWIVTVKANATAVFVEDGGVAVAARSGGALLTPGEGIDITADGTAGPVKTWGAGRVRRVRDRLGQSSE